MNLIVTLCFICIIIELYHVCYHDYIYNLFNPMSKRYELVKSYQDLWSKHLKFMEKFLENKETKDMTMDDIHAIEKLSDFIKHFGTKTEYFRKEFAEYFGVKMLTEYVIQQFIEITYSIIVIAIAFMLPSGIGIVFYIFMILISYFAQKNEKAKPENKIRYLYIADTLICLTVYLIIICAYI